MRQEVCDTCRPLFEILLRRIEELETKNAELERRLLAYENAHTPPSKDQRHYPKREPTGNPVGAPKGHQGTTRIQPEPTETKELRLEYCPDCNTALGDPKKVVRRIIEEIPEPQPLRIIKFLIPKYHCTSCDKEVIPTHPELPRGGTLGYTLQSEIVHLKFEDRLPLRKIPTTLNRRFPGLGLVAATILSVLERATNELELVYTQIKEQIKHARVVNADETGAKVQGKKAWFWTFISSVSVLFTLSRRREQKVIERILGKRFAGLLGCDGWKSYRKYATLIQRCWAHLLREAKCLAQNYNGQAKLVYEGLCTIFKRIKTITLDTIHGVRIRTYTWCMKEIKLWTGICNHHTELKKFAITLENGLDHWFTCVLHPDIEPTNNKAERALREFVIQRKITGTLRNEKGMHLTEVLMSVLATWKLQGLNTFSMLRQTLSS